MLKEFILPIGLIVLEVVTVLCFFALWRPKGREVTNDTVRLLGSGKLTATLRGDLLPPPEVLARDIVYNSSFAQSNDLKGYLASFPASFAQDLMTLGENARILDAGAGEALFSEQLVSLKNDPNPLERFGDERDVYFKQLVSRSKAKRPQVLAVDVEIKRRNIGGDSKLEVLSGRLFSEIPKEILGTFDLVVDNQGVFSYAPQIDETLSRYLEILRPRGAIHVSVGREADSFAYLSRVTTKDRGVLRLIDWVSQIDGLSVKLGVVDTERRSIIIKRIGNVTIPKLRLESLTPRGGEPPVRMYVEVG